MKDGFGREIDYVRISITDRCNLRCVYCMPESGVKKLEHEEILSYEEILRVARVMAGLGVKKIKITGGDPLVRKHVAALVGAIKAVDGIKCVTLTTNGQLLVEHAQALTDAGIDGINISLDTLDAALYRQMTRCGQLGHVLDGIDAALAHAIPVKLNCVPVEGLNAADIARVAGLAKERNIHVRFIEMMPIGSGARYTGPDNASVRAMIEKKYGMLIPRMEKLGNGPAKYYALDGFQGRIGFISALGDCFCGGCNRIRLTADGYLKNCLHMDKGTSIKTALSYYRDDKLKQVIEYAILHKPERHAFHHVAGETRQMSEIGG